MKGTDAVDTGTQSWEIGGRISSKALKNGVQITQGSLLNMKEAVDTVLHFRLTCAAAGELRLEGVMKFANAVRKEPHLEKII